MKKEVLISVDIEADGPIPGDYSMISLGACLVEDPNIGFYKELKPISHKYDQGALSVSGLDRHALVTKGADARQTMKDFADWLMGVCDNEGRPVFVAFNATFDWMFVHWYFIHFLGRDPFGISGWDIKAYYAGLMKKLLWSETAKQKLEKKFLSAKPHTHNALDDAREQAEIFSRLRDEANLLKLLQKGL